MAARDPALVIGTFVALRLAWGFCCVWRERSRRKTTLAIMDRLLAWERERRQEYHPVTTGRAGPVAGTDGRLRPPDAGGYRA